MLAPPSPPLEMIPIPVLPGYECQMTSDPVTHSREKLIMSSAELLALDSDSDANTSTGIDVKLFAGRVEIEMEVVTHEQSIGYRCSAGFQIIKESSIEGIINPTENLVYAMRNNFKPVSISTSAFPIANIKIQECMELVLTFLNNLKTINPNSAMVANLTSCKYVTPWNCSGCILTLSYGAPINDVEEFHLHAEKMVNACGLLSVTGRPKGVEYLVGVQERVLIDDITVNASVGGEECEDVLVKYVKPYDAFQHPNVNTMKFAINWILKIVHSISSTSGSELNILEMYCGCGAHTVAIGAAFLKSKNKIGKIVAVELDSRLVSACENNVLLNGLEGVVEVVKGDAGSVAKGILRRRKQALVNTNAKNQQKENDKNAYLSKNYNILIVDPPRSGLDISVIILAKLPNFENLIYISCGRDALLRDLKVLRDVFVVEKVVVTDLFPRTDSVETVVWLRRREVG